MEALLVINADCTSIKFAVYDGTSSPGELNLIGKGHVALAGAEIEFFVKNANSTHPEISRSRPADGVFGHDRAAARILGWLDQQCAGLKLTAVGHRVAHGGQRFPASVLVTDEVFDDLAGLAPMHQAHDLKTMRYLRERLPAAPHVACLAPASHRSHLQVVHAHAPSGTARAATTPADEERMIAASALRCAGQVPTNATIHAFPSTTPACRRDAGAAVNLTVLAQLPLVSSATLSASMSA